MLYIAVFGHVRRGGIVHFGRDHPIHRITLSEVRIRVPAELTVSSGEGVVTVRFAMDVHGKSCP
jgi:hypothetical protein